MQRVLCHSARLAFIGTVPAMTRRFCPPATRPALWRPYEIDRHPTHRHPTDHHPRTVGLHSQTCPAQDPPLYTTVTHLIVHHTAGANTAADWPSVLRSIWVLHVMGNGWNDIGYDYLIDPDGLPYEGRGSAMSLEQPLW